MEIPSKYKKLLKTPTSSESLRKYNWWNSRNDKGLWNLYYKKYRVFVIGFMKKNVETPWNDVFSQLCKNVPKYLQFCIKDEISSRKFLYKDYFYIEDGILKYHKYVRKIYKNKKRKQIQKKVKPLDPLFIFDYDIEKTFYEKPRSNSDYHKLILKLYNSRYWNISIKTSEDQTTIFDNPYEFIKWAEKNKKTYRIRIYKKENIDSKSILKEVLTKTNYD